MLISFTHRFIYFHVPRTGGGSLIASLRRNATPGAGATLYNKLMSKYFYFVPRAPEKTYLRAHEKAERVKRLLPAELFDEYFKIGFVRNPYSWLVSFYEVRRRGPNHRHHKLVARMSGFGEYVDWEIARSDRHQHRYLADRRGRLLVDFLGRYERLEDDHARLLSLLGMEPFTLPHVNIATKRNYRDYYDDGTRSKVASHWARDLEMFGYDFDGIVKE